VPVLPAAARPCCQPAHPISDASVAKTDSRAAVLPWLGYNLELLFEPEPPLPS